MAKASKIIIATKKSMAIPIKKLPENHMSGANSKPNPAPKTPKTTPIIAKKGAIFTNKSLMLSGKAGNCFVKMGSNSFSSGRVLVSMLCIGFM